MKNTKRIISLVMSLVLLLCCFTIAANAECCADYDLPALRDKFTVTSYNNENYAYFNPATEGDTTKYPVLVFLHGFGHEMSYLTKSWMPYYASDYLQGKFSAGGAHIILPQIWHIFTGSQQLQNLIEDYVNAHIDNVDTSEIILVGASLGARQAYNIALKNADYYSSLVLCCPAIWFKDAHIKAMADLPIWLISSKRDILTGPHFDSWDMIVNNSNVLADCRWTYFDGNVYSPDGKFQLSHFLAKSLGCDGFMLDGTPYSEKYDFVTIKDGLGNPAGDSFIEWAEQCAHK